MPTPNSMNPRATWVAVFLGSLTAISCAPKSAASAGGAPTCELVEGEPGPLGQVPVRVDVVARGLEVPWGLAFLPDGDLLVTERPGRVRRVHQGVVSPEPVLTVPSASRGESGLLGLALDPSFSSNRRIYLYVTQEVADGTQNRVERWVLSPSGTSATRDKVLVEGIAAAPFHDGGRLRFGPDGLLYIATGDAGQPERAQDPKSLSGKLLRVTPDGAVPPDNPFSQSPVFLLGLRNSEGFDWLEDGAMVVSDHGPSGELGGRQGHDELNVARAGENLGWPLIFGCEERSGLVAPRLSWVNAVPPGGAAVYRADRIPEWTGSVLIGSLGATHLHRVVLEPGAAHVVARHEVYFQGELGRLREVLVGPDGYPYVTTSNCDGRGSCPQEKDQILRVVPAEPH